MYFQKVNIKILFIIPNSVWHNVFWEHIWNPVFGIRGTNQHSLLLYIDRETDRMNWSLPEIRMSPDAVGLTAVTGPRWWSILIMTSFVLREVMMILESSPPLTTTVSSKAEVTLSTGAICSLENTQIKLEANSNTVITLFDILISQDNFYHAQKR